MFNTQLGDQLRKLTERGRILATNNPEYKELKMGQLRVLFPKEHHVTVMEMYKYFQRGHN